MSIIFGTCLRNCFERGHTQTKQQQLGLNEKKNTEKHKTQQQTKTKKNKGEKLLFITMCCKNRHR